MNSRKIIKAVTLVMCVVTAFGAGMIYVVFGNYRTLLDNRERVDQIMDVTFRKRVVADDYLLHRNERAKEQWFIAQTEIEETVAKVLQEFDEPQERAILTDMQEKVRESRNIFTDITTGETSSSTDITAQNVIRLGAQLTSKAQEVIALAAELRTGIISKTAAALRTMILLFSAAIALYLILLIASFSVIWRSVNVLARIDEMKSDFVSLVSHQLKTPVAQVKGYVENMLEGLTGDLNEKQRDYLNDMLKVANKNSRLIDDLLNISRIERGLLMINFEPLPFNDLMEDVLGPMRDVARQKGVRLAEGIPKLPLSVVGDPVKTREAIRNIVDNALKFTKQGGTVSISAAERPQHVEVSITDEGPGIDPNVQSELFEKNRIWSGKVVASGAGLGLFLSKQFIELTGGSISFKTVQGKGTTFVVKMKKQA